MNIQKSDNLNITYFGQVYSQEKNKTDLSLRKNADFYNSSNIDVDKLGVLTYGIEQNAETKALSIIRDKLSDIEKKNNIKIIYACEAGSKAWGDNSINSDYDIRYVYISPKPKYLDDRHKDFIKSELTDTYDIYGFDLSKLIKEIKKQGTIPFEWLNSPIKYINTNISDKLENIAAKNTNIDELSRSYKKLTVNNYNKLIAKNTEVSVKSYLTVLKSLLMADYIDKTGNFPPLTYQELFDTEDADNKELIESGKNLLRLKKENEKTVIIPHLSALDKLIEERIKNYSSLENSSKPLADKELDLFFENVITSPEFEEINKVQLTNDDLKRFELYPNDNDYRKKILSDMGSPEEDYLTLKSIIGPQEFKEMVTNYNNMPEIYSTGVKIKTNSDKSILYNVVNGTYRANLHIHTQNSDGELSTEKLLETASKYADKVAKINTPEKINRLEPFTIAITDHNTVNGCKEAIDIIRHNPDKYKNLRVVLGSELSTSEKSAGNFTPKKPYQIHLLTQCINPYDKKLNKELEARTNKENCFYSPICTTTEVFDILSNQPEALVVYAHPLKHQSYKKAPSKENMADVINDLIFKFKNAAGKRDVFVENYYQSYNTDLENNKEIQDAVKNYCANLGLISTGGLDNHGNSIFFK